MFNIWNFRQTSDFSFHLFTRPGSH